MEQFVRRSDINSNNLAPVVNVISVFLLILIILAVITRFATKAFRTKRFELEDGLICAAVVFAIGQVATVLVQTENGLGRPRPTLTAHQLTTYQKCAYAVHLLYVANLGVTKLSVLSLIYRLNQEKRLKNLAIGLIIFVAAWTIATAFAFAFQCRLPDPWNVLTNTCYDRESFWIYFAVTNTFSEVGIILLAVAMTWKLQVPKRKKFVVFSSFALRVIVIVAIVAETVYFIKAADSTDPTLKNWSSVLCGQVAQTTSIITACFLHIKPFLRKMDLGLMNMGRGHQRHSITPRASMSRHKESSYLSSKKDGYFSSGPVASQRKESPKRSVEFGDYRLHGHIAIPAQAFSASQVAVVSTPPPRRDRSRSKDPHSDGKNSRQSMHNNNNNIRQVRTFGVDFERDDERRVTNSQAPQL